MKKELVMGNEAFILAALSAGCEVFGGYPITPSSEGAHLALKIFPDLGKVAVQMESEIAVGHMLYAAGAAGARNCTITSGPGYVLLHEGIVYAATAQAPMIVGNVMRGGPGLGNIAPSQADYNMVVKGGGNGDYQTIVLAPSTVQEIIDFTILAFDLADKWRNPVTVLFDGFLGQMEESAVVPKPIKIENLPKKEWAVFGNKNIPAMFIPFNLDPKKWAAHNVKLQKKYKQIKNNEIRYEAINLEYADIFVVAFGFVGRIMKSVIKKTEGCGVRIGLLRPQTLWPFPNDAIRNAASRIGKVVVAEMNCGQMLYDVKLAVGDSALVHFLGWPGGLVPGVNELFDKIKSLLDEKTPTEELIS